MRRRSNFNHIFQQFQSLAKELKAQLEAAQKVKEADKSANVSRTAGPSDSRPSQHPVKADDDDNVVVLSRMNREGMSRPLPERTQPAEQLTGKKRRRKEKVNFSRILAMI